MSLPLGEIEAEQTVFVCPRSGSPSYAPVAMSQIRIVWSPPAETMRLPSGKMATDHTGSGPARILNRQFTP